MNAASATAKSLHTLGRRPSVARWLSSTQATSSALLFVGHSGGAALGPARVSCEHGPLEGEGAHGGGSPQGVGGPEARLGFLAPSLAPLCRMIKEDRAQTRRRSQVVLRCF